MIKDAICVNGDAKIIKNPGDRNLTVNGLGKKTQISTETVDACSGLMGFSKCNSLDQHHSRIHTYRNNLEAAAYMSRKSQHRTV